MAGKLVFTGTVVRPSYNCPDPPNHQTGWVLRVQLYVEGELNSPYPVGCETAWANGCFKFVPQEGDKVLVNYTGDKADRPEFVINKT
jgi:hypothetical protein